MTLTDQLIAKAQEEARNKFDIREGNVYTNLISLERFIATIITEALEAQGKEYDELILAVGNKYKGETRHETALRYIKMAEQSGEPVDAFGIPKKGEE